ncbi:hypothetical protein F9879_20125, partial [Morganella morganii]|uniref:hypothetical protein n=1 Tax=Morganella morganii TaxID=582 RepID=UPI0015F490F0
SDEEVSTGAFETQTPRYRGTHSDDNGSSLDKADNKKYPTLMEADAYKRADAQNDLFDDYRQNNDMDKALSYLQKGHDSGDIDATETLYKY